MKKKRKKICDNCDISYACDHKSMPDCEDFKEKEIEERDELASEICKNICIQNNCVNSCSCADKPCNHSLYIAEELVKIGYHKTIWHKVADEDLPKESGYYYCHYKGIYLNSGNPYIGNHTMFWDSKRFITDITQEVIAWTELPKYEEKEEC